MREEKQQIRPGTTHKRKSDEDEEGNAQEEEEAPKKIQKQQASKRKEGAKPAAAAAAASSAAQPRVVASAAAPKKKVAKVAGRGKLVSILRKEDYQGAKRWRCKWEDGSEVRMHRWHPARCRALRCLHLC